MCILWPKKMTARAVCFSIRPLKDPKSAFSNFQWNNKKKKKKNKKKKNIRTPIYMHYVHIGTRGIYYRFAKLLFIIKPFNHDPSFLDHPHPPSPIHHCNKLG